MTISKERFSSRVSSKDVDAKSLVYIGSTNEMGLYFLIHEIGGYLWRADHDWNDGRISDEVMKELTKDLEDFRVVQILAIQELEQRFSLGSFLDADFNPTEAYWSWYRRWDGHIKGLSEEVWQELSSKFSRGEDVSEYFPKGAGSTDDNKI